MLKLKTAIWETYEALSLLSPTLGIWFLHAKDTLKGQI
jgi:hypothetical protein